jgi:hypothetical protein
LKTLLIKYQNSSDINNDHHQTATKEKATEFITIQNEQEVYTYQHKQKHKKWNYYHLQKL